MRNSYEDIEKNVARDYKRAFLYSLLFVCLGLGLAVVLVGLS